MTTNAVARQSGTNLLRTRTSRRLGTGLAGLALWLGLGTAPMRAGPQPNFDRDAFLSAIAEVETGHNPRAIGRHGERGLYQFTRTTWRIHTKRAFADAHVPWVADAIAAEHFDWLCAGLVRNGREPTPYLMAAAWNGGLRTALTGRMASSTRDYARRVSNLTAVGPTGRVQVAVIERPTAPAVPPVVAPARTVPPVVLNFDLTEPEPGFELAAAAPAVVPVEDAAATVAFSLAPATSPAPAGPRFFFATIGE